MTLEKNIHRQACLADEKLARDGLVLTQGGEPTFVAHDTAAAEWNIAALGPQKLDYARRLAGERAGAQSKGGVILQSFGKQYPDEPLPRWQIGIYRSRIGKALWSDIARRQPDVHASPKNRPAQIKYALDYSNSRPAGERYDAPLGSEREARRRIAERICVREEPIGKPQTVRKLPSASSAPHTLNLRRA